MMMKTENKFTHTLILSFLAIWGMSIACTRSVSAPPITPPPENTVLPVESTNQVKTLPSPTFTIALTEIPASPTPTAGAVQLAGLYAVVGLGEGDLLNVRSAPGTSNAVLETLGPGIRNIQPTGKIEQADGITWLEIQRPSSTPGWVSRSFLTEQVEPQAFCADERIKKLVGDFSQAIKNQDGEALSRLVSPVQGLTIQHNWWNPEVKIESTEAIRNLFFSTTDYDWGTADGSGEPLVGPFKDIILPKLQDVLSSTYTSHCNILESPTSAGATSGLLTWPAEYANMNYVALYRAAPAGEEMNWRTWVIGIDYVAGVPYIASLVQYTWEI
jgi:hypothetical protein